MTDQPIPNYRLYGAIEGLGSGGPLGADRQAFLHVETIAARSRVVDWTIRPHRHEALQQFLLIQSGHGHARADAGGGHFAAPCLITIPPGIVHGFSFAPDCEGVVLTVSVGLLADALARPQDPDLTPASDQASIMPMSDRPDHLADLVQAFATILRECDLPRPGWIGMAAAALRMIAVTAARLRLEAATFEPVRPSHDLVLRFKRLVENRYQEHCSVTRLAAELSVTPATLSRACTRVLGRSPQALMQERLLLEAKRHLLYTSMTAAQTAYALGFKDPGYFSRFFTRHTGMPPARFRSFHARTTAD